MSEMQHFGRLIILLLLIGLLTVTVLLVVNNRAPQPATPPLTGDEPAVLVGAGDIAECGTEGDEATAALIDGVIAEHPDAVVFTSGDNAYDGGLRSATTSSARAWQQATATISVRLPVNSTRLQLTLYADRYEWQFLPVEGATFTDSGSGACH